MTQCKGTLSFTLPDGSKDECLVVASNELDFYYRIAFVAVQIKELHFKGEDCNVRYSGDFSEGVVEMLSTDNFRLFLSKLGAVAQSKYENGINPLK